MKAFKLIIVAIIAIALILLVFIYGGRALGRAYLDFHADVKYRIESIFSPLPFDDDIKLAHFEYMKLTRRGHYNGVTFLNDGRFMLDTLGYTLFLNERADNIVTFNDVAERNGAQFLYVRIPSKLESNSLLPLTFSDNYIIEGSDALMNLVSEYGVDTLDLRAKMESDGMDYATSFFRGDHHWTIDKVLWAFGKISEHANNEYGFSINEMTWDPNQYGKFTFAGGFLGEESIAVNALDNYEDMNYLYPNFHTEFVITDLIGENYMAHLDSGNFVDVFIPQIKTGYTGRLTFGSSNQWSSGFTRYENSAAGEDKSVLLVMDSMGIPLATFFANAFTRVDNLYLQNGSNHRIWYAVENYNYDLVILAVSDVVVSGESTQIWHHDRLFLGYP